MFSRVVVACLPVVAAACATTSTARPGAGVEPDSAARAALAGERAVADSVDLRRLGVTPFRVSSSDVTMTALGYALADLITTDLARSSQLALVERSRLGDVLRELDLVHTGRIDSSTAPRVGRLIRASRLVLGSVDSLPDGEIRIGLRLADVSTGGVEQALDSRAPLRDILEAEKQIVFRLFTALGVTLTPAERAQIESRPATSLAALTAYGRGVQAEMLGDPRRARDEFQRALRLDPAFQPASDRLSTQSATSGDVVRPTSLPGVKTTSAPLNNTVDRLNRPLDFVTANTRPSGGPGDPAFPSTIVTVFLTVRRP